MSCPACDSLSVIHFGYLGRLEHFRCRDCGMDFSRELYCPGSYHAPTPEHTCSTCGLEVPAGRSLVPEHKRRAS